MNIGSLIRSAQDAAKQITYLYHQVKMWCAFIVSTARTGMITRTLYRATKWLKIQVSRALIVKAVLMTIPAMGKDSFLFLEPPAPFGVDFRSPPLIDFIIETVLM